MRLKNRIFETFGDGVLSLCVVTGREITGTRLQIVRFGDKTIGVTRFFQAKIASDQIERMISIPYIPEIRETDLVIIGDVQYKIVQIQKKFDAVPPCMYLSLKESKISYKDARDRKE